MLTLHIEASCSGKKELKTFWTASKIAKNINRNRDNARCQVYRCWNCNQWHVGNVLPKNDREEVRMKTWA